MTKLKYLLWALASLLLAVGASAQTVSIVSGNGQLTSPFSNPFFSPLVVSVKDASGAPIANATVLWTVTSGQGTIAGGLNTTTTTTDTNGQTSVVFSQPAFAITFGLTYLQSTVTATSGVSSVTFFETTSLNDPQTAVPLVTTQLLSPPVGTTLTGQSGQQGTTPITISVGAPNVELRLVQVDTTDQAQNISCVTSAGASPGTVLSDASGNATCTPIFGGQLGTNQFQAIVGGGFARFGPWNTDITAGPPCAIRIVSGNNQSGNAGQNLAAPLVAEVNDCGGNRLSGVPVTWSVTQGAATLFNTRNTSASGLVSTNVTLGSSPGQTTVQVSTAPGTTTATGQAVTASFTMTTNLTISGMQKAAGDNQDAAINTAFSQPLVVQVTTPGQSAAGVTIQWAVTGGSVTLGSATSVTNAQGQASNTVQAGATTGPATVTATVGSFSVTFNLTVRLPGPANVTFLNGAGFQQNFIAPCGVATIRGTGLATGIQGAVVPSLFGPLPFQLANVTVQFGNSFAPIYSVINAAGQESVTVQVPCEVQPGNVPVTIRVGGGSAQFSAQVSRVAPGIFQAPTSDGQMRGVLLKPDGTFVSLENPARRGETIRMYATGLGPVLPAVPTNSPGLPDTESMVTDLGSIVVGVNNAGVRVVSAQYASGLIGAYEVAFVVPDDVPSGNLPLALAVREGGSLVFGNPSSIPVQ